MIILDRNPKIGKVPDYNGIKYGKIQLTAQCLSRYVGESKNIKVIIFENDVESMQINRMITYAMLERYGVDMSARY